MTLRIHSRVLCSLVSLAVCVPALPAAAASAAAARTGTVAADASRPGPAQETATARGTGRGVGSSGEAWRGGGLVARATGRVFFTLDGVRYACSGAFVAPSVVVTAAHCVSDGDGGWATAWTFVPGYTAGRAPYGSYPASAFYVTADWVSAANITDDVAFVTVRPGRAATGLTRMAGGRTRVLPVAFTRSGPAGMAAVFGYPAEPPFTGQELDYCRGRIQRDPHDGVTPGIRCAMTEGDSGGPWLSDFNPRTGTGVITAVTSFKYSGERRVLYAASLGTAARSLYDRAMSEARSERGTADPPTPGPATAAPKSGGQVRGRSRSGRLPNG